MRRIDSESAYFVSESIPEIRKHSRLRSVIAAAFTLVAFTILAAAPAAATPANFSSVFGFEEAGLEDLQAYSMGASDGFLNAGEGGGTTPLDVTLTGSTGPCIFTNSNPVCQASTAGITDPYSVLVTFQVSAVDPSVIDGPFTLFLSGLVLGGDYGVNEVSVELNPVLPEGLDTSGIPGFALRDFSHIVDETFGASNLYHYIGWKTEVGETISFRYDVSTAPGVRGTPQMMANAISRPIPEPGTALLMGIGLAGLAVLKQRGFASEVR